MKTKHIDDQNVITDIIWTKSTPGPDTFAPSGLLQDQKVSGINLALSWATQPKDDKKLHNHENALALRGAPKKVPAAGVAGGKVTQADHSRRQESLSCHF